MNLREILHDFSRRYLETYILVKFPNDTEYDLFYVQQIAASSTCTAVLQLYNERIGAISLNMGSDHSIKFAFPPCGVFQYGKDAHIFVRRPRRQWRKGICGDNSYIEPVLWRVSEGVLSLNTWRNHMTVGLSTNGLLAAFASEVFTPQGGWGTLLTDTSYRSVALDKNYSIHAPIGESGVYTIFHWRTPVAVLGKDGNLINVLCKPYVSEVKRLLMEINQ